MFINKNNIQNELTENEQIKDKKGIKKKTVMLICIILAVIIFMFILVWILDIVLDKLSSDKNKKYEFEFYEANYSENIFEDEEYLELIKNSVIMFSNMDNVTFGITEDEAIKYGEDVDFMVKYVHYMTYGMVKEYNECYSELYYTVEEPKKSFTMQKIYDVSIEKLSQTQVSDDGQTYSEYIFTLTYKIHENNGTLRDDFLNGTKKQFIRITNREGELKIDGISTAQYKK